MIAEDFRKIWYASATVDPASVTTMKAAESSACTTSATCGEPQRGCTLPSAAGSAWSNPAANGIRVDPEYHAASAPPVEMAITIASGERSTSSPTLRIPASSACSTPWMAPISPVGTMACSDNVTPT